MQLLIEKAVVSVFFLLLLVSCASETDSPSEVRLQTESTKVGYPLKPVPIQNVRLSDNFWLPIIEKVQERTIEFALEKCKQEGRFDNFLIAGGEMDGAVRGAMPFDDTDVYKIIEGASNSLISSPNNEMEVLLDSLILIIKTGQEQDGYLTTWRTIDPAKPPASWVKVEEGKRWESLAMSHELYNAGHLYEAAAVHFKATGKRNFLNIALQNADLMVSVFGEEEGKIHTVPGHQIIETGLIKLFQITGKHEYMTLAKYFLDNRGRPENHELFGSYSQDHVPVTEQDEVVGHAVRAVYMYAAMTDIAALQKDTAYLQAVNALWSNMVNKKMYITGGIGAKHEGESFGENYELPNLTAYNETCASIGDVYWNHRLHNFTGDVKYFDVIERTMFNGLISGLSLDGKQFFYPNALESDGVYKFNQGECTRKSWFDCSCCPTNVIRFIPSIPGLIYSTREDTLYVNLYASNEAEVPLKNHSIKVSMESGFPWNGDVSLSFDEVTEESFKLKLRVPGWSRNEVLPGNLYSYASISKSSPEIFLNGEKIPAEITNGYIVLDRKWSSDDVLKLNFPYEVRTVETNELVVENRGKFSLEYGPLVYAVEEIDNPQNFDAITLKPSDTFKVIKNEDLLEGVNQIKNETLTAIPYYAWSNRGIGKMKVWIHEN